DVVRVQVGEAVGRVGTVAEVDLLVRAVVDDHAVDDVERLRTTRNRARPAQADGHTAARRAAVCRDLRTGNLARERGIDRHCLRLRDLGAAYDRNRVAQRTPLGRRTGSGDYDPLQRHGTLAQRHL